MPRISPCACRVVLSVFLAALFLLSPHAPASLAAEAALGKETPLRVKNVDIDGVEVRLPIPDGYEEMQWEDHPATYVSLVENNSYDWMHPIIFLINSEDKVLLKQGNSNMGFRYGVIRSEALYQDEVIGTEQLNYFKTLVKQFVDALSKRADELLREENRLPLERSLFHEGKKSVSFFNAMKENWPEKPYRSVYYKSFLVVDKKIVEVTLKCEAFNELETQKLKQDALRYLQKFDSSYESLPSVSISQGAGDASAIKTPLRTKEAEIRGTKIRLPIPDGYEEMQREDYPETYDWMVKTHTHDWILPLLFLINSEDKAFLKQGKLVADLRYGLLFSEKAYWDAVIGDEQLEYFRTTMKKYAETIAERVDESFQKENRMPMTRSLLHEGKKSVSFLAVTQEKEPKEFFHGAANCPSYFVVDKKVVEAMFWRDAYDDPKIEDFKKDMLHYLKKIDSGNY